MQLKTILNQVCRLHGFVYGRVQLVEAEKEDEGDRLDLEVCMRATSRTLRSSCGKRTRGTPA